MNDSLLPKDTKFLGKPEKVDITPDKSLMEKLGYVGFSLEDSLAEFIDNALDARYDEETNDVLINQKIKMNITIKKDKIIVEDNSSGILRPDECLKPALSRKGSKMLGKFGLGLKTASMSLGKKLTIITERIGIEKGYVITFDLDEWYKDEKWEIPIRVFKKEKNEHGTKLIIEKLWPLFYDLEKIKEELAFRFSEFIDNNELEIIINEEKCIPESLEFISKSEFEKIRKEFNISKDELPNSRKEFLFFINGMEIVGWVDLLAKWSYAGSRFGFNLYRGKRLLQPFQKIGIKDHVNYSRIFGHIYLPPEVPVKFTKDGVEIGKRWFIELIRKVNHEIKIHIEICEKLARKKRFYQVKPKVERQLNLVIETITKIVNTNPILQEFLKGSPRKIKAKKEEAEATGIVDTEKRGPKVAPSLKKPIPKGLRVRQPRKKKQKKKSFYITVMGKKVEIEHYFDYISEPDMQMYYAHYDEEEARLTIATNQAFDSWNLTKDETFYATMNIITAVSEFIYEQAERPQYSVREIRETLWREVGKQIYQQI